MPRMAPRMKKRTAKKVSRTQAKPFRDRIAYSPIVDRPRLKLPGGARVAVWTIVNAEEWAVERPMPRTVLPPPMSQNSGQPLLPDLPNWAWHEYGMRVGFWRFLDALKPFQLKAPVSVNRSGIASYEPVAKAALDAGWEVMGNRDGGRPEPTLDRAA